MSNIAFIVLADERDRNPHGSERGIPLAGSGKCFTQCLIDLRVAGNKRPPTSERISPKLMMA